MTSRRRNRCVIFDMDGTLADVSSIRHHIVPMPPSRSKNFVRFHEDSVNVPPHEWVVRAAHEVHKQGFAVIIVTARGARFRNQTAMWLALNGVPSDLMFMRPDKDHRPDFEVKKDILNRIRDLGFVPILAFDDNPNVIALWESENIPVVRVPGYSE